MNKKRIWFAWVAVTMLMILPVVIHAAGNDQNSEVTIYFTRHAEKQTVLVDADDGHLIKQCGASKCAEELSSKGILRANLLADWFARNKITEKLTHAYASHKLRTRQTILPTVKEAQLGGDTDKNADDGIQEFPVYNGDSFALELSPEKTSASEQPTIDALMALPPGSVALVAGHSGTLYDIMAGLGLDDVCLKKTVKTCNQDRYPINNVKKAKVADYGDIWKIVIRDGQAKFQFRKNLQIGNLAIINQSE